MKKTSLLILLAAAVLSSCGAISQATSENGGQRFQDGIYSSSPSFRTRTEKTESQAKTDELINKTKASKIYLFGEHKDSIMIPENFSARIQFDQKVGGTVVTVGENPYDWRWDLENNYGYYYGPYSLGSSWYWSRHYNPYYSSFYGPYWSSWSHNPWRYYSYYDPWYYGGYYGSYYDPWHYGGYYDPWYYGGYYSGYWGWHDPWHHYHHHCGWYSPHHGPHHISHSHYTTNIGAGHRTRTETGRELSASPATSVRSTGSGTNRGSMSVGNRTARSVTSRKSGGKASTASSTVSRPSSGNRSSSSVQYRRPSSSTTSTASSSSSERSSSSSRYTRGSSSVSRSSSSSATRSSSSYDSGRSSSYSRGSSSSYSRSSSSSYGGSSSGSYSRGSSSGSYRR